MRKKNVDRQSTAPTNAQGVGYARPPEHTRFVKGTSGNPRGRRKGSRNMRTIIRNTLIATVTVREGERTRSVSKLEGIVLKQIESALKGNEKAALATLKMAGQVGLLDQASDQADVQPLSASEQRMLDEYVSLFAKKSRKKPRSSNGS